MSEQDQVLIDQEPVAQPMPGQPEPEEKIEIEVVTDVPPEDQGKARAPETKAAEQPPDQIPEDELATYSDRVKKRINRLKYEFHEERRRAESAERQSNEAIQYAQGVLRQNQTLQTHLQAGARVLHQQVSAKADAELEQAKRAYKDAYESGDADAIMKANENMSRLVYAKEQVRQFVPPEPQMQQQPQQQQQMPQQAAPAPVTDPKAKQWASENTWFGTDHRMTSYALAVHQELLNNGMDTTSDEYYKLINKELHERFPEKFQAEEKIAPARRAQSVVAPVLRSIDGGRKVRLTETQVAVARKLGVSAEQYAREVLKMNQEASNG